MRLSKAAKGFRTVFSLVLSLALLAGLMTCAGAEGKVKLSVWSFTDELEFMIEDYYAPDHPEVEFEFETIPSDGSGYELKLDAGLAAGAGPDIFAMDSAFVKRYINSDVTADLKKIGFTDEEIASVYPMVSRIGQDDAGVQKGLSWQAAPGALLYRESLAQKYLGVSSPEEFQKKVSSWDGFLATARELNTASGETAKMITGTGDLVNPTLFFRDAGWVVDGKLNIDKKLLDSAKLAKSIEDEGLSQKAEAWGEEWFAGMRGETDTLCYFLPTWGLPYVLTPNCVDEWDSSYPDSEENIQNATENGTYGDWRIAEGPVPYNWGGTWLGVSGTSADTADEAKKAAMHDLVSFLTTNEDFQLQYFANTSDFVSNKDAVKTILETGGTPQGILNGQDSYAAFASVAEKVDGSLLGTYDATLNDLWNTYVVEPYTLGEKDLDACVAEFREQAKAAIPSLIVDASGEETGEITEEALKRLTAFVERNYSKILGREADPAGEEYWVDRLKKGEVSGGGLMYGFVNSAEFKNKPVSNQEKIEIMYNVMLDRPADEGGIEYWLDRMNSGMSINAIAAGFVGSEEFKGVCTGFGIDNGDYALSEARDVNFGVTSFVARCYGEALGRTSDEGGLNYWCGKMLSKEQTPQQVAAGFVFSPEMDAENKIVSNPDALLDSLYKLYLGREADEAGKAYWKDRIAGGLTLEALNEGFAASAEFTGIVAGYGLQ